LQVLIDGTKLSGHDEVVKLDQVLIDKREYVMSRWNCQGGDAKTM